MIKQAILAGTMLLSALGGVQADPIGNFNSGYSHMMWGGAYGMVGGFFFLAVLAVIVALAFLFARSFSGLRPSSSNESAIAILRERFASGEIDEQEFLKRLAILQK